MVGMARKTWQSTVQLHETNASTFGERKLRWVLALPLQFADSFKPKEQQRDVLINDKFIQCCNSEPSSIVKWFIWHAVHLHPESDKEPRGIHKSYAWIRMYRPESKARAFPRNLSPKCVVGTKLCKRKSVAWKVYMTVVWTNSANLTQCNGENPTLPLCKQILWICQTSTSSTITNQRGPQARLRDRRFGWEFGSMFSSILGYFHLLFS